MNKRRKAYLRQLVAEKKKVPGLSEDDVRYIVSHINSLERKELHPHAVFDSKKEKEAIRMILDAEVRESILSLDGKEARDE